MPDGPVGSAAEAADLRRNDRRGRPRIAGRPRRADRRQRDRRFHTLVAAGEALLNRLLGGPHGPSGRRLRLAVIVAHPDDEAIGAGILLRGYPNAVVVHVTDGGGSMRFRGSHDERARAQYCRARREEVVRALALVGIDPGQIRCLGFPDGSLTLRLAAASRKVGRLIRDLGVDVVLTHPYEGGHTDHDATAFAVHLACGGLRRSGLDAPLILELTSYHARAGQRVAAEFLAANAPSQSMDLGRADRQLKSRMFAEFETQRQVLRRFPVDVEQFRIAPRYQFTLAPHPGTLEYERHGRNLRGSQWRELAAHALAVLRGNGTTPSG